MTDEEYFSQGEELKRLYSAMPYTNRNKRIILAGILGDVYD